MNDWTGKVTYNFLLMEKQLKCFLFVFQDVLLKYFWCYLWRKLIKKLTQVSYLSWKHANFIKNLTDRYDFVLGLAVG